MEDRAVSGASSVTGTAGAGVGRIETFFSTLTPASLNAIADIYAEDARFKDPFSEVGGILAITHIYERMFATLDEPRFVVTGRVLQGRDCFLIWDFHFRFKRIRRAMPQTVHGCSHLVLDDLGRIAVHRDYWDAAEELYEKIPFLGGLMRWLKKRAGS